MSPSGGGWEHFETEADVGVHAWGETRAEAFAQVRIVAVLTGTVRAHGNTRHAFYAAGNHEIHRAGANTHGAKVNCL